MSYEPLSNILASGMITTLGVDFNFDDLADLQKIQIINSAQQVVCDYYNKNGKDNYLTDTSEVL
jgi:hypothetical protein